MNESTSVNFCSDRITIMTKTKVFFVTKPQSAVIPFLLDGRMTSSKGFIVFYSTTDDQVLQSLHNELCTEVSIGNYQVMLQRAQSHQCIFSHAEWRLGQYITGYKY